MTVKTVQGTITANRATLNRISIAFQESAKYYARIGAHALEENVLQAGKEIYEQLEKSGYFK